MAGRILIVEDEIIVAMDLEATLEDFGFETVGIAADKASALQLGATNPDVAYVAVLGNIFGGLTGGCDASPSGGCLQKFVKKTSE